jgi:hypothetical protein
MGGGGAQDGESGPGLENKNNRIGQPSMKNPKPERGGQHMEWSRRGKEEGGRQISYQGIDHISKYLKDVKIRFLTVRKRTKKRKRSK